MDNKLSELSKPVAWKLHHHDRYYFEENADVVAIAESVGKAKGDAVYSQEYVSALTQRIAELEASETQLIQERESAEQALADMYEAATGERPEWSNWFGFADAVEEVAQVRARLDTPVRLPGSFYPDGDIDCPLVVELDEAVEAIRAAGFVVEGGEQDG